jgi:hypothetical protein
MRQLGWRWGNIISAPLAADLRRRRIYLYGVRVIVVIVDRLLWMRGIHTRASMDGRGSLGVGSRE